MDSFNQSNPVFARFGLDNSMWGPLIEKAWAKVNGNYEAINTGLGLEAFAFLTNTPSRYYFVNRLDL